jgi:anaerobic ribonucleoside-triphosphate reductase
MPDHETPPSTERIKPQKPPLPDGIVKRDGRRATFEPRRIAVALLRAGQAASEFDEDEAELLTQRVLKVLRHRFARSDPTVEQVLVEANHLYNLEATPTEGTTYRFAREDKKRYPGILQAGTPESPYYTNSTQLPVGFTDDPFEALERQDELQTRYTGGAVLPFPPPSRS